MSEKIKVADGYPVCPRCGSRLLFGITHNYWAIPVYEEGDGLVDLGISYAKEHDVSDPALYCTNDECGYEVEGFVEDFEITKGEDNE